MPQDTKLWETGMFLSIILNRILLNNKIYFKSLLNPYGPDLFAVKFINKSNQIRGTN